MPPMVIPAVPNTLFLIKSLLLVIFIVLTVINKLQTIYVYKNIQHLDFKVSKVLIKKCH
jgi:hypothetical protein